MAQVHVIIGEDEYLVSEAAKRIVGDGIGLETVDSANSSNAEAQLKDIREAEASLMTPPSASCRRAGRARRARK